MSWYTNPWVIGTLGSIPGGFFVNWLTGKVLGKRENREYLQKVSIANREVIYAIRPGISEGQIPSADVLHALVNATARRYGVEVFDLYSPSEIAEDLTKEVMDSSFISSAQKNEYCSRLANLGATAKGELSAAPSEISNRVTTAEYRARLVSSMSMLLGLLTVSMTIVITYLGLSRSKGIDTLSIPKGGSGLNYFLPALAAILTVSFTGFAFWSFEMLRRIRKRREVEADLEDFRARAQENLRRIRDSKPS